MDLSVLTTFLSLILAVSIAAERMVEIVKGWLPDIWLFKATSDPSQESRRGAVIHVLACVCGFAIAALGKLDIFKVIHADGWPHEAGFDLWFYRCASWIIIGLLASGGSAFWNHSLELLKATKIQQQQKAIAQTQYMAEEQLADGQVRNRFQPLLAR